MKIGCIMSKSKNRSLNELVCSVFDTITDSSLARRNLLLHLDHI